MNSRKIKVLILGLLLGAVVSCQKNNVSVVPYITTEYFGLNYGSGPDTPIIMHMSADTLFFQFSFSDGDGDLGNDTTKQMWDIYIKDFRYDTGFVGYLFPEIDKSIEDPKKGLKGLCTFLFYSPNILTVRVDSVHSFVGDTTHFEVYIMDRAGHKSNHVITPQLIMVP